MKQFLFLICFLLLITNCKLTNNRADNASRLLPEPDILERLQYQKSVIDSLFIKDRDQVIVLARLAPKGKLVQVMTDSVPENTETVFYMLKDSSGQIISISEIPESESGDWFIVSTHYFDQHGSTFAYDNQTNFFNSLCTDGIAYETVTKFYNSNFQLIDSVYKLVDENNKSLQRDSCQFLYGVTFDVFPDCDAFLRASGIKGKILR